MGISTCSDPSPVALTRNVYRKLFTSFGPQHWWPAKTPFEMMVGAILVQNTSWKNVENVISQLVQKRVLTPKRLLSLSFSQLAAFIRPVGYFRVKAKRLRSFVRFFVREYQASISKMRRQPQDRLRTQLLSVYGVGEETADSMLLYALDKPFFVIDNYTKRIFERHKIFSKTITYQQAQQFFHRYLPQDVAVYNEYHALLVRLAKDFCRTKPLCAMCPLNQDKFYKGGTQ